MGCCPAQLELFCISKLINCLLDADEEFVFMDIHFAIGKANTPEPFVALHPGWHRLLCSTTGAALRACSAMPLSFRL